MTNRAYSEPRRQHGIGLISVLVMMSVGIFLGLFAMKIVPEYMEHWTVEQIAKNAQADPEVLKQAKAKIYVHLNQAYRQNNLWDLTAEDTIVLEKIGRGKGYSLKVKYEKRIPFFHNIHLVTAFDSSVSADKEVAPKASE